MRIDRYDNLITVLDSQKNIMLALKLKIEDDKLYAYNLYLPVENRKILEIKKINGINISSILNQMTVDDLYNVEKLKNLGIDTSTQFVCTIIDENKEKNIDIFKPEKDINMFYKKHEINEIIPLIQENNIPTTTSSNNIMLDYASSNVKSLLMILKNLSLENRDKSLINDVLGQINNVSGNYNNINNNLDMIFLSSQLLKLNEKLREIPNYIENVVQKILETTGHEETDDFIEANTSILTNNKIDYKKIIVMIRNCIAHSNYKVLEDGNILFYNDGKDKLDITFNKNDILYLFDLLYDYYYLSGTFPIIHSGINALNSEPMDNKMLEEYLNKLEIFDIGDYTIREYQDLEKQRMLENNIGFDSYKLKEMNYNNLYNSTVSKELIKTQFDSSIKRHLVLKKEPNFQRLTEENINYILENIKELNEDHFYSLSKTSQILIINDLIYQRYNKNYYFQKNISEIINTNHFDNNDLSTNASDYIKYKSKVELVINSLLNNLLLFCYNHNKSKISAANIRFPLSFYNDYLNSRVANFYEVSKETNDYRAVYTTLLKNSSTHAFKEEDYKNLEKQINDCQNRLIKTRYQLNGSSNIIEGNGTEEEYEITNKDIFNRLRDSLAHGSITINIKNIHDISSTELHFFNKFDGIVQFDATITLGDFLITINQPDFINSILNDNQNFRKHLN